MPTKYMNTKFVAKSPTRGTRVGTSSRTVTKTSRGAPKFNPGGAAIKALAPKTAMSPRSNAGGALRGQARVAAVKKMNVSKKGRVRTGGGGNVAAAKAAQQRRAVDAVTRAQRANTNTGSSSSSSSKGSTPSGVGIGFNAMVRRGAGNAIKAATGKRRKSK